MSTARITHHSEVQTWHTRGNHINGHFLWTCTVLRIPTECTYSQREAKPATATGRISWKKNNSSDLRGSSPTVITAALLTMVSPGKKRRKIHRLVIQSFPPKSYLLSLSLQQVVVDVTLVKLSPGAGIVVRGQKTGWLPGSTRPAASVRIRKTMDTVLLLACPDPFSSSSHLNTFTPSLLHFEQLTVT